MLWHQNTQYQGPTPFLMLWHQNTQYQGPTPFPNAMAPKYAISGTDPFSNAMAPKYAISGTDPFSFLFCPLFFSTHILDAFRVGSIVQVLLSNDGELLECQLPSIPVNFLFLANASILLETKASKP